MVTATMAVISKTRPQYRMAITTPKAITGLVRV
jgi:hypothetical protein